MKQAQAKRAIIVGIFILLGIVIFIGGVLTLGGQKNTFEKTIAIKAIFNDVGGLQAGNNVWFSGVKIGTVKKVQINSNERVEITMRIEQHAQSFIHQDAKAKIGSDGLIGNKIVVIYGGTPGTPAVTPSSVLANGKSLHTEDLMNTLQENNQNLAAITTNFKIISEQMVQGRGTVGKLLMDDTLVQQLQGTALTMQTTALQARTAMANLVHYSSKLETKGSLTNEVVSDTTVFNSLKTTVAQMQEVSKTANDIADNLKNASLQLRESNGPAGLLLNDAETGGFIKTTLKNLQNGTQKLDENMDALQHSFCLKDILSEKQGMQINR